MIVLILILIWLCVCVRVRAEIARFTDEADENSSGKGGQGEELQAGKSVDPRTFDIPPFTRR